MIKHIVLWNLKDKDQADANAAKMKEQLEALVGQAQGLISAQVGRGFVGCDVALIAELESREALDAYQNFEPHVAIKNWIGTIAESRTVCDFEC